MKIIADREKVLSPKDQAKLKEGRVAANRINPKALVLGHSATPTNINKAGPEQNKSIRSMNTMNSELEIINKFAPQSIYKNKVSIPNLGEQQPMNQLQSNSPSLAAGSAAAAQALMRKKPSGAAQRATISEIQEIHVQDGQSLTNPKHSVYSSLKRSRL